jgi:hypothetical protein
VIWNIYQKYTTPVWSLFHKLGKITEIFRTFCGMIAYSTIHHAIESSMIEATNLYKTARNAP